MRFIVSGSIAAALPPSLVPRLLGRLRLARFGSLGLIALGFALAMTWNRSLLPTHFSLLTSRADGDQTGFLAIPASQSAASMTAVFTSYLYRQTSGHGCVLRRATSATVRSGAQRCGGERRCPFVGCITVAACSVIIKPLKTESRL